MLEQTKQQAVQSLMQLGLQFEQLTDLHKQILQAALIQFSEKGFAATTAAIAKQANTTEKTLFKYVESKEKLYTDVLSMTLPRILDADLLKESMHFTSTEPVDPFPFFRNMALRQFKNMQMNPHLFKFALQEMVMNTAFRNMVMDMVRATLIPVADQMIELGQKNGQIRQMPKDAIIRFLLMNLMGFVIGQLLGHADLSEDTQTQPMLDMVMNLVVNGIGKQP